MDFSAFRENLNILMDSRGYDSNNSLAIDLNVPAATISRWRTGNRAPEISYVIMIAQFFEVSVDWLLGLSSDRFSPISDEMKSIIELYSRASKDDRIVIQAVLAKYKGGKNDIS